MLERAISWCLRYQRQGGEIAWSVGPDGAIGTFALLAATSSFQHSLRSAARVAEVLGHQREAETWSAAAGRAAEAVADRPGSFEPKDRWAMEMCIRDSASLHVPPGDPGALATALGRLLSSTANSGADLGARLGQAGRRRVLERFTWARCAAGVVEQYRLSLIHI